MLGAIAPYLVAVSMMLFAGISALTLIYAVGHLEPPDADAPREARTPIDVPEKIAV